MKIRDYVLAVVLTFAALVAVRECQAASPANTYCSSDSGVTWLPCGSGGGGGGSSVTPTPSSSSSAGIAEGQSSVVEASHVLCSGPCNLFTLTVNNGATAGNVLVYNATSAPVDGVVSPAMCFQMPATNSTLGIQFNYPAVFSTGVTVVYSAGVGSTNCKTQTSSTSMFAEWQVK